MKEKNAQTNLSAAVRIQIVRTTNCAARVWQIIAKKAIYHAASESNNIIM